MKNHDFPHHLQIPKQIHALPYDAVKMKKVINTRVVAVVLQPKTRVQRLLLLYKDIPAKHPQNAEYITRVNRLPKLDKP